MKKAADRRFDRQYGGADRGAAGAAEEAGPRAAVYKGEMGASHRRAARMQNACSGRAGAQGAGAFAKKRRRLPSRLQSACLAVALTLVVGCAFLYAPARQYYQELRERDRIAAEYEAVQARNDSIQSRIDLLSTDEGVADTVRAEFGWVADGETLGSVSGLSDSASGDDSAIAANIVPGSIEAPDTWYSFLDPIFGVE